MSQSNFYQTLAEASQAVQNLAIKDKESYSENIKWDDRLPRKPQRFYARKGWKGWDDFLGQKSESTKLFKRR